MQHDVRPRWIHFLFVQIIDQSLSKEGITLSQVERNSASKSRGIAENDIATLEGETGAQPADLA